MRRAGRPLKLAAPARRPATAPATFNPSVTKTPMHKAPRFLVGTAPLQAAPRSLARAWLGAMAAVCVAAASTGAAAQTQPTLKALVATHGSLAAGDVVFTNFRTPVFPPITMPVPIRAGLALGGGADVAVQALLAADGSIALTLTPIDPVTGLPQQIGRAHV